jgi:hypothetical protein
MTERLIWVPFLPPSVNNMFENRKNRSTGKTTRVKSAEARTFERRFVAEVVPNYQGLLREMDEILEDPNIVAEITAHVYFESLVNKTWPKAKSRYKVLDADNRGKATFDAFRKSVASIDDSRFFHTGQTKNQLRSGIPPSEEGVLLEIHYSYCSKFGVPETPCRG